MAMKSIINNFGAKLIVASRRVADINETVIAFITAELDILTVTPCYLKISRNDLYDRQLVFNGFDDCKSVYFSLPKYMCISDVYMLRDAISRDHEKFGDKEIVLLLSIISGSVADTLKAILPMCRLINV